MENHESGPPPKRRLQKKSATKILLPTLLIILLTVAVVYFLYPQTVKQLLSPSDRDHQTVQTAPSESLDNTGPATDRNSENDLRQPTDHTAGDRSGTADSTTSSQIPEPENQTLAKTGVEPDSAHISGGKENQECKVRADGIESFFDTLDSRPYMQAFNIGQKSDIYFPHLIQKLVNNPPVVSGETDDLFTILQNTAHFFRIIGRKNIIILKGILDREKPTFEKILADFYQLTFYPECLKESFNLTIDKEPLYQYAGFFLNTMGGRLYLFRRDSMSRMVVSYYAILIVEQANREGRNKYGIELAPMIDNLINEIESSRIQLQMRDTYLDTLYSFKEKYQQ